jgi:hypothetical protein
MPKIVRKFEAQASNPEGANQAKAFYAKVLKEAEKMDFEAAIGLEGLDGEIAILRVKLKDVLEHDSKNLELIMEATNLLGQLVKARYHITDKQKSGLGEAIQNIMKDIAVPLGIAVLRKKL